METYRYVLNEDDFKRLVAGEPISVKISRSNQPEATLGLLLSDIGTDRMVWYVEARRRETVKLAYRDDAFPERPCDRCGQPYRGPAVYCSLTCAMLDA